MIEIQRIKENKEEVLLGLSKRNIDAKQEVEQIIALDHDWRLKKTQLQDVETELNAISKQIGVLFSTGKQEEAKVLKSKTGALKEALQAFKIEEEALEKNIQDVLFTLPNVCTQEVPAGKDETANEIIEEFGTSPSLEEAPVPHWELAKEYTLIDFELGVKVTGAGFPFYRGQGARFQRALVSFFLDEAVDAGYEEFISPLMVNENSGKGTGQLPDKEGQMYYIGADDLYLIPTAEVPLTNIYRDVILPDPNFSIKLTGHTPCFRREAGSYGKDVRGLNRLHQFEKVEIVRIETPENSEKALHEMIDHIKSLLQKLGLQYRVLRLCGGDTGFAAAITYDFEVYSAAQEKWLEVSSVSRFDTFQSNRLKLRFKDENKKSRLCHTLNGSALALPRIMAALLENNQGPAGINIPEPLRKYTGFDMITKK
tara:strand:- start:637 stop:1914 length:1278 start_codon:yes stop_codon:yes gene_type:complete